MRSRVCCRGTPAGTLGSSRNRTCRVGIRSGWRTGHMEPSKLFLETVFPITQRRTCASNATTKKRAVSLLTTNQLEGTLGLMRSTFSSSILAGTPERCITM
jgi:hypothetical protein